MRYLFILAILFIATCCSPSSTSAQSVDTAEMRKEIPVFQGGGNLISFIKKNISYHASIPNGRYYADIAYEVDVNGKFFLNGIYPYEGMPSDPEIFKKLKQALEKVLEEVPTYIPGKTQTKTVQLLIGTYFDVEQ